uniref:Spermatogenesis associated 22 n=1 Tax=Acanthochromis polyacanthus TaxID=80966 RepID=A0A3Q1F691_9TELE
KPTLHTENRTTLLCSFGFPLLSPSGCLSVPLFNQKKRNRIPLTSTPSENEFFSHSEYMASISSATSHSTPGEVFTSQYIIKEVYFHFSSGTGPSSYTVRQQDSSASVNSRQNKYQTPRSESAQSKPTPRTGFSQMGRQPSPYSQQSRPPLPPPPPVPPPRRPSAHAVQPQKNSWKFTNSFEPQRPSFEGKRNSNQPQTARPTETQVEFDMKNQGAFPVKPAIENSLRILTAVIDGMRHWSQFRDKVPYLFEIFATLDSAVTLGRYGAKNFLIRDGKDVVQCVFYENEQVLPRLIRGQVHRCVGNYDRSRDVLICVSVRPGLPSELRNAQEAVKACDAEMRLLVKLLSEV